VPVDEQRDMPGVAGIRSGCEGHDHSLRVPLGGRYNFVNVSPDRVIRMGTQARADGKPDRAVRAAEIDAHR
jgi:hypothetical protein